MSIAELLVSGMGQPWSLLTEVTSAALQGQCLAMETPNVVLYPVALVMFLQKEKCDPELLDISLEFYRTITTTIINILIILILIIYFFLLVRI